MLTVFFRTLASDLKRSIFSRMFVIALVISLVAMWSGAISDVLGSLANLTQSYSLPSESALTKAFSSEALLLFMPIIAAVPFTTALLDDLQSGFIKHYLTRSRYMPYTVSKTIACAISSALALGLGLLIGYISISIIMAPVDAAWKLATQQYDPEMLEFFSFTPFEIIPHIIPYALSGMLWGLIGMLMSLVTMNKYMAYASPFILYYVLVILAERYFRTVYVLNPQNYVTLTGNWDLGPTSIYITLGLFTVGVAIITNIVAQRRLRA